MTILPLRKRRNTTLGFDTLRTAPGKSEASYDTYGPLHSANSCSLRGKFTATDATIFWILKSLKDTLMPAFCSRRVYLRHASRLSSIFFDPVHTIFPELKVKAVVLGLRMRIVIAANLSYRQWQEWLACVVKQNNRVKANLLRWIKIRKYKPLRDLPQIQVFKTQWKCGNAILDLYFWCWQQRCGQLRYVIFHVCWDSITLVNTP